MVASPGPSHLGLEWQEPRVRDFWETIGQHHIVVRYDRHGCGLSDRNRSDFSLDSEIRTIEAIVKELGLKSLVLLGQRHGGAPAIGYAVVLENHVFPPSSPRRAAVVVGDDGVHSRVRSLAISTASPTYGGDVYWRGMVDGLRRVDNMFLFFALLVGPLFLLNAFEILQY